MGEGAPPAAARSTITCSTRAFLLGGGCPTGGMGRLAPRGWSGWGSNLRRFRGGVPWRPQRTAATRREARWAFQARRKAGPAVAWSTATYQHVCVREGTLGTNVISTSLLVIPALSSASAAMASRSRREKTPSRPQSCAACEG